MVTVTVSGDQGSSASVEWYEGMNAQNALEEAYSFITFAVQYYGADLGYYAIMFNGVYDLPNDGLYWEFFYNGKSSSTGIDSTILNDGDAISFENVSYNEATHKGTSLEIKHRAAQKLAAK